MSDNQTNQRGRSGADARDNRSHGSSRNKRGVVAMSPSTLRRIAYEGARASYTSGRISEFSAEEYRYAARKSGLGYLGRR